MPMAYWEKHRKRRAFNVACNVRQPDTTILAARSDACR